MTEDAEPIAQRNAHSHNGSGDVELALQDLIEELEHVDYWKNDREPKTGPTTTRRGGAAAGLTIAVMAVSSAIYGLTWLYPSHQSPTSQIGSIKVTSLTPHIGRESVTNSVTVPSTHRGQIR